MRGVVVITESMLTIGAILVSIILLVVVFNTVFSFQARSVEDTALSVVARDLELSIDRIAASASSAMTMHEFPKGIKLKIFLDSKGMEVSYIDGTKTIKRAFAASMNIDRNYSFDNPGKLCLIKNRNDGKILVAEICDCNINDDKCDPACLVNEKCDMKCYKSTADNICDSRCVKQNDNICDPDCYRNEEDLTVDMDCIKSDDGICDPDTDKIEDKICDNDCYTADSKVCDPDCKPVDKNNDKTEDEKDGICYTACSGSSAKSSSQVLQGQGDWMGIVQYYSENDRETARRLADRMGYTLLKSQWPPSLSVDNIVLVVGGQYANPVYDVVSRNLTEADNGKTLIMVIDYAGKKCYSVAGWHIEGTIASADYIIDNGLPTANINLPYYYSSTTDYVAPPPTDTECCCDASGKCSIETRENCLTGGKQTYPLNHEYCKGLSTKAEKTATQTTISKITLPKDGVCDVDCEEENNICDPDCTKDEDCKEQCALKYENCTEMPCCSDAGVCCPGDKVCRTNCCGNGKCEASYILKLKYPYLSDYIDKYQPAFEKGISPYLWENYYTCPVDCESKESIYPSATEPTWWFVDGVCDRVMSFSMDPDCCEEPIVTNDEYCKREPSRCGPGPALFCNPEPPDEEGTPAFYNLKDEIYYCDPDVAWDGRAMWGTNTPKPCPVDRTMSTTRHQAESDGKCVPTKDYVCDDCANDNTLCDPDCCDFNSPNACPSSPGCYCPTRVSKGDFAKSPYFTGTDSPDCDNDNPHWTDDVIEICSEEAIKFLDRRGWDINQVAESLKADTPEGWAFEDDRYQLIAREGVQKATKTIKANEEYTLENYHCCCSISTCPSSEPVSDECCGVGFCGDHATAMLSILRTLGVPAKDVFAAFYGDRGRHAFVVYKCDSELPSHLKLKECEGHENEWLKIDATFHSVEPLQESSMCNSMCIWWNDYGTYPAINATIHGFGGLVTKDSGYPFPPETGCKPGSCCGFQKLCPSVDINCIV